VHKAAQVASITDSWGEKEKNPNAILNVAILTSGETRAPVRKSGSVRITATENNFMGHPFMVVFYGVKAFGCKVRKFAKRAANGEWPRHLAFATRCNVMKTHAKTVS
jgi:hypothetical protein